MASQGTLAMSRGTFSCHNWGQATDVECDEAEDSDDDPATHSTAPATAEFLLRDAGRVARLRNPARRPTGTA